MRGRTASMDALVAGCLPADPIADDRTLFLPRVWQRSRAPSSPSTSRRRPCPETTCRRASGRSVSQERDEGIGLGGADEVVHRDAAGGMGREADDAVVVADLRSGDGLAVGTPMPAHPRHATVFEPAIERVPLLDRAAGLRQPLICARWLRIGILAHGALAAPGTSGRGNRSWRDRRRGWRTRAARRSTAGGWE